MPLHRHHSLTGLLLGVVLLGSGCAALPPQALALGPESQAHREMQTRRFDGKSEGAILSASVGVLQDLGFTLDGTESKLGVISASRKLTSRRPLKPREIVGGLILAPVLFDAAAGLVIGAVAGIKEPQVVRVSLVTSPGERGAPAGAAVRVTAQRLLYQNENLTQLLRVEPLNDEVFYAEFFSRLSKSVFLEEQKI